MALNLYKYLFYNKLGYHRKKTTKDNKRKRNYEIYRNLDDDEEIAECSSRKSSNYL
jgi:hypothetical protein